MVTIKYTIINIFFVVCGDLDSMIVGGQTPDLILDLTRGGVNSEVVKSLREVTRQHEIYENIWNISNPKFCTEKSLQVEIFWINIFLKASFNILEWENIFLRFFAITLKRFISGTSTYFTHPKMELRRVETCWDVLSQRNQRSM